MSWIPEANTLLFFNIWWNLFLFMAFGYEQWTDPTSVHLGKAMFYLGATILTVGLWVME